MATLTKGLAAGSAATAPMTIAMEAIHRNLPPELRYPLPPRLIAMRLAEVARIKQFLSPRQRFDLAVRVARMALSLPYFDAEITCKSSGSRVRYECHRTQPAAPPASFVAWYAPSGPVFDSQPGWLDYWLTERYCLYTLRKQALLRLDIRHRK